MKFLSKKQVNAFKHSSMTTELLRRKVGIWTSLALMSSLLYNREKGNYLRKYSKPLSNFNIIVLVFTFFHMT